MNELKLAYSWWRKDFGLKVLSLIPVIIASFIYYLLGSWIFNDLHGLLEQAVLGKIGENWGWLLWPIKILLGVVFYFITSWTFVLFVSLVSSPFLDLMSERLEKLVFKQAVPTLGESFETLGKSLGFTLLNEFKKVILLSLISLMGFALSFIPILAPLTMMISAYLLAASLLDYSWARHNFTWKKCLSHLASRPAKHLVFGALFLLWIAIPILNLVALPIGVMVFTLSFLDSEGKPNIN